MAVMGAATADDSAYRYDKDGEAARAWARWQGLQWSWRSNQWMTPLALAAESQAAEIAFMEARQRQDEWSAFCETQWRYHDARERAGRPRRQRELTCTAGWVPAMAPGPDPDEEGAWW